MSRVGKAPIKIVQGVKFEVKQGEAKVEGPKGKLSRTLHKSIDVKVADGAAHVTSSDPVQGPALRGLTRTLLHNMVVGVSTGFTKELDIVGVGYRANVKGSKLNLTLGFSHPVEFDLPAGVTAKVEANTHLVLSCADRELLGQVAAKIRGFRPPEPYQGKGIKYSDERIIRKQGKAAGAK